MDRGWLGYWGVCLFSLWMEMRSKTMWRQGFETSEEWHIGQTLEWRAGLEDSEEITLLVYSNSDLEKFWPGLQVLHSRAMCGQIEKVSSYPGTVCSHVRSRAGFRELLVMFLWQTCSRTDHLLKTFFWCLKQKLSYLCTSQSKVT